MKLPSKLAFSNLLFVANGIAEIIAAVLIFYYASSKGGHPLQYLMSLGSGGFSYDRRWALLLAVLGGASLFLRKVSDVDVGKQLFALGFLVYHVVSIGMRSAEFHLPLIGFAIHGALAAGFAFYLFEQKIWKLPSKMSARI